MKVVEKLRDYGYVTEEVSEALKKRIKYAFNWSQDFMEIKERSTKLENQEIRAIKELIQLLKTKTEEGQIQNTIFTVARKHAIKPAKFFKTLYTILLGVPEGPRLGPYIIAMGRENVLDALKRASK